METSRVNSANAFVSAAKAVEDARAELTVLAQARRDALQLHIKDSLAPFSGMPQGGWKAAKPKDWDKNSLRVKDNLDIARQLRHEELRNALWKEYRVFVGASLSPLRLLAVKDGASSDASNQSPHQIRSAISTLIVSAADMHRPIFGIDRIYSVLRDLDSCEIPSNRVESDALVLAWHRAGLLSAEGDPSYNLDHFMQIAISRQDSGLFAALGRFFSKQKSRVAVETLFIKWFRQLTQRGENNDAVPLAIFHEAIDLLCDANSIPLALAFYQYQLNALSHGPVTCVYNTRTSPKFPLIVYKELLHGLSQAHNIIVECFESSIKSTNLEDNQNYWFSLEPLLGNPSSSSDITPQDVNSSTASSAATPSGRTFRRKISAYTVGTHIFKRALAQHPLMRPTSNSAGDTSNSDHRKLYNRMLVLAAKWNDMKMISTLLEQMNTYDLAPSRRMLAMIADTQVRALTAAHDAGLRDKTKRTNLNLLQEVKRVWQGISMLGGEGNFGVKLQMHVYESVIQSLTASQKWQYAQDSPNKCIHYLHYTSGLDLQCPRTWLCSSRT
ncbi:hypothetical protein BC830DRAFT_1076266 [Chytriomyces sp. MP71]|nr:hypothetical protein BC830DRAFT_1076266 [Chytriomyces sp. MP71]